MKTLNLIQNTDAWLEAKLNYDSASEAPAALGKSKHISRNQLLDIKKGWKNNPLPIFKEKLFQKAHEHEDSARDITEIEFSEDFPPIVGLTEVDGVEFLASFDGLEGGEAGALIWEHKDWNETLAGNVRNGVLEDHYWIQLEHQCIVAGSKQVLFTCSDGTQNNRVNFIYKSQPERQAMVIAGWKQFNIDLETHEIEAKQELIVAREVEALPVITCDVNGSMVTSNIKDCLPLIKARAAQEMSRVLESDQDFADKDKFNKEVKAERERIFKDLAVVRSKFESFSEYTDLVLLYDAVLQPMQSGGEKQVTDQKKLKKQRIADAAIIAYKEYLAECSNKIAPVQLANIVDTHCNLVGVMKGKRTIKTCEDAVDDELAAFKARVSPVIVAAADRLEILRSSAQEYSFLFQDLPDLVMYSQEGLKAVIESRITKHKEAETERLEAERETIRQQEKEKLEAAAAKKKAKEERERIDQEKRTAFNLKHKKDMQIASEKAKEKAKEKGNTLNEMSDESFAKSVEFQSPSNIEEPEKVTIIDAEPKSITPHDQFVLDLNHWSTSNTVSFQAMGELEEVLKRHGRFY